MSLLGCASRDDSVSEAPRVAARWVNTIDDYEPGGPDHGFYALSFVAPAEGWIAGRRFLLHAQGDDLTATLTKWTGVWITSVAAVTADEAWATGFRTRNSRLVPVLWHYQSGGWNEVDPGISWPDWTMESVLIGPNKEPWIMGKVFEVGPNGNRIPARWRVVLLARANGQWTERTLPASDPQWKLSDFCFYPDGDGLFIGNKRSGSGAVPVAYRLRDDRWSQERLPEIDAPVALIGHLACVDTDSAVVTGWMGSSLHAGDEVFVLRYEGGWNPLPLPEDYRRWGISAISAPARGDIWLAVDCSAQASCAPRFLHWADRGGWRSFAAPALPEGRTSGYGINDMQFVSADEGWAVGDDSGGPGLQHGVIMQYTGGQWRLRQWTMRTADLPWFGLFGY